MATGWPGGRGSGGGDDHGRAADFKVHGDLANVVHGAVLEFALADQHVQVVDFAVDSPARVG